MQKSCGGLEQWRVLNRLNIVAFVLHLFLFIASLIVTIIFAPQSFQSQLTSDFRGYGNDTFAPPAAGPFSSTLQSLGYYQLIWVNLAFPLITAVFHRIAHDLGHYATQWHNKHFLACYCWDCV